MLRQDGLVAVLRQVPSDAPNGRVVGQNSAAGTKLGKGGRVTLNVALQLRKTVISQVEATRSEDDKRLR